MLPSTFTSQLKREEDLQKKLRARIEVAKFLQKALDDMAQTGDHQPPSQPPRPTHARTPSPTASSSHFRWRTCHVTRAAAKASATPENKETAKKFVKLMQGVRRQLPPSLFTFIIG